MSAADGPDSAGGARARARRLAARGVRRLRHGPPRLSVVVTTAGGDPGRLRATIDSVRDQPSPRIEILVVVPGAHADAARAAVGGDTRARVITVGPADDARAVGVAAAAAGHLLLAAPGDRYRSGALAELADELDRGTTYFLATGPAPYGRQQLEDWPQPVADPRLGRLVVPTPRLAGIDEVRNDAVAFVALLHGGFEAARSWGTYLGRDDRTGPFVARTNPLERLDEVVRRDVEVLDALAALPTARAEFAVGALLALWPCLAHAEVATPTSWDVLVSHAAELVEASGERLDRVDVAVRVAAQLAAAGHRDALVALVSREEPLEYPTVVHDGVARADLGVADGLLPDDAFTLGTSGTPLETEVLRLLVDGPVVRLEVLAGLRDVSSVDPQVSARTIGKDGFPVAAWVRSDAVVDRWADQREQDHRRGLVTLELMHKDLRVLENTVIELAWEDQGLRHVTLLHGLVQHGSAARLPVPLGDGRSVELRDRSGVAALVVTGPYDLPQPTLNRVLVDGDTVRLTTPAHVDDVRLVGEGRTVVAEAGAAGFWALRLRAPDPWSGDERPLPSGRYRFELRSGGAPVAVVAASPVVDLLPATWLTDDHRIELQRLAEDGVAVRLGPPLTDDELGRPAQRRLQREFRASDAALDPELVYVQSFTGQHPNDNPLAILTELRRHRPDLDVRWLVADASAPVPEGVTPVLLRSRAWYDAMTRATYLVTNIELEKWFARRPGQQVLQTFHGYPSKAMGLGLWRPRGLTPAQIEAQLDHTSRVWNTLVTPDPAMDAFYRRDYAYDGTILATGYPRNDVLVTEGADRLRVETRARLGIRDDQHAVLYAPTWRDDLATDFRAATAVHHLDVERAAAQLGDGYVLLLRGHRFHAPGVGGSRVVDVTTYPDVNHLIAASDAAVLDYSSLRFDFALTGRPMVFLVPDLETYGSSTRGFLWDYRETAPGPLVATTGEVVDALRDLDGLAAQHGAAITAFNERYNSLHDGHAAERVVSAFFAPLLG